MNGVPFYISIGLRIFQVDLLMLIRRHYTGSSVRARLLQLLATLSVLLVALIVHGMALGAVIYVNRASLHAETTLEGVSALVWNFLIFVMTSGGLIRALIVLHEQDDTDLIISSPAPIRSILAARLFGNTIQSCTVDGFIIVPWINIMVLTHGFWYLCGYPIWILLAMIVTSYDGLLTLSLVRYFGFNRARACSCRHRPCHRRSRRCAEPISYAP